MPEITVIKLMSKAAFIGGDSASRGNLAQRWIFPRATNLCWAGGPVGAQQCR